MERFDLVVVGAGPGGYVAAIRAAQLGKRVACIEKRTALGGTCLNVGCIPSKAMLDSSELFAQTKHHLSRHGVVVGDLKLDLPAMLARKDRVVDGLTKGVSALFRKNKITSYNGIARLAGMVGTSTAPGVHRIILKQETGEETIEADAILLATGSEPVGLSALPFDGHYIVSSTEALSFDRVPEHLIVVGGGYIGLELGSVWARLGARVTVVEFLPRILPLGDAEIAQALHRALEKQGLTFVLETRVTGAGIHGGQVTVQATCKGEDRVFQGDKVLVAIGRRPYTIGLGLKEAGVTQDERSGRIPVDEDFQTNVSGIYAIGDLIEGPMLAHKAEEDGIAFAERLAGMKTHVRYDTVPSVIYTHPEVASVGPTEEEIKKSGREYKVGKFPLGVIGRARCMDEPEGLVKVIADADTDRILAVHIFGPRASEMISEAVTVMEFSGSAEDIARICHAHPTLSEAVREAALAVDGRAIHM